MDKLGHDIDGEIQLREDSMAFDYYLFESAR
jgi:hypothetical protein